jgi:threonine/homoserine/homoserine lactone efflux protein
MYFIIAHLSGILIAALGALPFGLVNLSVLGTSYHKGFREGMRIAHGAAIIEVLYGLISVIGGLFIQELIKENSYLNYSLVAVIGSIGIVFLFKNDRAKVENKTNLHGFWKGVFLNLISIQVFLFWVIAVSFLYSHNKFYESPVFIIAFLAGIWVGKMSVLWLYARLSRTILSRSKILSNNINRVIGSILLITVIIQFLKF